MIMIIIIIATMLTGRFATTFTANWQNCYRKIWLAIITKIVTFFLIINPHPVKITMVML